MAKLLISAVKTPNFWAQILAAYLQLSTQIRVIWFLNLIYGHIRVQIQVPRPKLKLEYLRPNQNWSSRAWPELEYPFSNVRTKKGSTPKICPIEIQWCIFWPFILYKLLQAWVQAWTLGLENQRSKPVLVLILGRFRSTYGLKSSNSSLPSFRDRVLKFS